MLAICQSPQDASCSRCARRFAGTAAADYAQRIYPPTNGTANGQDRSDQRIVRAYFERLTAADYDAIVAMFEKGGWVDSPFLGKIAASDFFAKLGKASSRNMLTVHDVLFGENGDSVAAQFEYDWTLASGDKILFQGVDYFRFGSSGKFASMSIFYDTYPAHEGVGDTYG